jgi:hypothetical protein
VTPNPLVAVGAETVGRVVMLAFQVGSFPLSFHLASSATQEERHEAMVLLIRNLDESGQAKAIRCARTSSSRSCGQCTRSHSLCNAQGDGGHAAECRGVGRNLEQHRSAL